jgi:hypothetical protein
MSGHFFVPETVLGGVGNDIFVFGFSHLLIVVQSRGIPVFTLPSPECIEFFNIWKHTKIGRSMCFNLDSIDKLLMDKYFYLSECGTNGKTFWFY